jgi:nucleotide-binding universal stress UspA family protein
MSEDAPITVVGVDGSPSSVDALQWAVRYASAVHGSVRAVIAWQQPMAYGPYPGDFAVTSDELLSGWSEKTLSDAVAQAVPGTAPVDLVQRVVEGHPATVLIDEAATADLLVVGARGHSALTGMVLGSVSSHCVHHSPCPVVVMRDHRSDPK